MSGKKTVQVSDLSESEVDEELGQKVLNQWDEQSVWLPDGFSETASVESTELIVSEREIDRSIVATEYTEEMELSESEYRSQMDKLHSEQAYRDRDNSVPKGGKWEGGTLAYKVPNTHRETNCSECSGSGRLSCRNCGSSGSIRCPKCNGTGRQETKRDCPRCQGSGWYNKETNIQCGQCAGKGYEVVDEKCMQCRGTGNVTCPECGGSGHHTCQRCEGEGLTHKLEVLYRECEPQKSVEHTTHGVPESVVKDADGRYVGTKNGSTSSKRPKHEIEERQIDVLQVDYSYEDEPLIGDGGEEKEFTVYLVEGEFKQNGYPKSQTRKVLPILVGVGVIILAAIIYTAVL